MNEVRIVVKWLIGQIKTHSTFVSLKPQIKIDLSTDGKFFLLVVYFKMLKRAYMRIKYLNIVVLTLQNLKSNLIEMEVYT